MYLCLQTNLKLHIFNLWYRLIFCAILVTLFSHVVSQVAWGSCHTHMVKASVSIHEKASRLQKKCTYVDCEGQTKSWLNVKEVKGAVICVCAPCAAFTGNGEVTSLLWKWSVFKKHERCKARQDATQGKDITGAPPRQQRCMETHSRVLRS